MRNSHAASFTFDYIGIPAPGHSETGQSLADSHGYLALFFQKMTKAAKRKERKTVAKAAAKSRVVSRGFAARAHAVSTVSGWRREYTEEPTDLQAAAQLINDIMTWHTFRNTFDAIEGIRYCDVRDVFFRGGIVPAGELGGAGHRHCIYMASLADSNVRYIFDANVQAGRLFSYRHLARSGPDGDDWVAQLPGDYDPHRRRWAYPESQKSFYDQVGTEFGVCAAYAFASYRLMTADAQPMEFTPEERAQIGAPLTISRLNWVVSVLDAPGTFWLTYIEAAIGQHRVWRDVYQRRTSPWPPVNLRVLHNILGGGLVGFERSEGEDNTEALDIML